MLKNLDIIVDNGEKIPWMFDVEDRKPGKPCVTSCRVQNMFTGDYSLKGFEDQILIERKKGFAELFGNMIPAENKRRFEDEMERMSVAPWKYLIIESTLNCDVWGFCPMQMKYGPQCGKVFEWLEGIQRKYGVHVIYAGDAGKKVARKIFDMFAREC